MRKLLMLAIPLLLFGFTLPGEPTKKEKAGDQKKVVLYELCVASCTATHMKIKIIGTPPTPVYMRIDGVLVGTGGRVWDVPKTGSVVTFTAGAAPGVLIAGDNIATLVALCDEAPTDNCP